MCNRSTAIDRNDTDSWNVYLTKNLTKIYLNKPYFSNACHVCYIYGKDAKLKRCAGCHITAYCNKQHQILDWPLHKMFCRNIRNAFAIYNLPNVSEMNVEEWYDIRKTITLFMKNKVEIGMHEWEMIWYQRACLICHRQKNLEDCENCPCISFCIKHKNEVAHDCDGMRLIFKIETTRVPIKPPLYYMKYISNKLRFKNMNEFLTSVKFPLEKDEPECSTITRSEQFSRPLTLFYSLQILQYLDRKSLAIHFSDANMLDISHASSWEMLFHILPILTSIKIVLVAPSLSETNLLNKFIICPECLLKEKKLLYEKYVGSYENYMRADVYKEPDLIVKFYSDFELIAFESSSYAKENLQYLAYANCPYIFAFYSKRSGNYDINFIKNMTIHKKKTEIIFYGKNPFASLRPFRGLIESDDLLRDNNYLAICRNVDSQ